VLLIGLARFKPVNDLYGHAAGNWLICAISERLQKLLHGRGITARLGGDEFALLVSVSRHLGSESLVKLAQDALNLISVPVMWKEAELKVSATIGVALISSENPDANSVMHAADLAMYEGKRKGRSTYCFYKSAMDAELKSRATLEMELRNAIKAGNIIPYYQPVVSLSGQDLIGVEVLARWNHPTRGLIQPAEFIPIAEETGMIDELSFRLLRQACLDTKEWPNGIQLAVNFSPLQFQDPWLAERIVAVLTETGFPPSRLEVEVTETALVHDLEATRATLQSLQNMGVRIALDDFGTGYSSLYHLRELKFNKLKIDRSYIDAITSNEERAKLVDAIIKLGTSLGLVTTAEGIETAASVDWLANHGCDFGQGYFFGKPMSKLKIERLIKGADREAMRSVADVA
jgi:diguanylate cyclase (GGDEF)-like protein